MTKLCLAQMHVHITHQQLCLCVCVSCASVLVPKSICRPMCFHQLWFFRSKCDLEIQLVATPYQFSNVASVPGVFFCDWSIVYKKNVWWWHCCVFVIADFACSKKARNHNTELQQHASTDHAHVGWGQQLKTTPAPTHREPYPWRLDVAYMYASACH